MTFVQVSPLLIKRVVWTFLNINNRICPDPSCHCN